MEPLWKKTSVAIRVAVKAGRNRCSSPAVLRTSRTELSVGGNKWMLVKKKRQTRRNTNVPHNFYWMSALFRCCMGSAGNPKLSASGDTADAADVILCMCREAVAGPT